MPTTTATAPVTLDRNQLLAHEGFRSLTSRERGAFLLTLCLLTHTDPDSPLHNCLCVGTSPMTLEEWGREVGEAHRAPAKRLFNRLMDLGLLEYHEHNGRQYTRVCLSAKSAPSSTSTPSSHSSHDSHNSHTSHPAPAEAPPADAPLTPPEVTAVAREFVRLSGQKTSLTQWLNRIKALGRTPEGAQALRKLLNDAETEILSPTPPKDPTAMLETRLNDACRAQYVVA